LLDLPPLQARFPIDLEGGSIGVGSSWECHSDIRAWVRKKLDQRFCREESRPGVGSAYPQGSPHRGCAIGKGFGRIGQRIKPRRAQAENDGWVGPRKKRMHQPGPTYVHNARAEATLELQVAGADKSRQSKPACSRYSKRSLSEQQVAGKRQAWQRATWCWWGESRAEGSLVPGDRLTD